MKYVYTFENCLFGFLYKNDMRFSTELHQEIVLSGLAEISTFEKQQYLPLYWSDKGFNDCELGIAIFVWRITWNYAYTSL